MWGALTKGLSSLVYTPYSIKSISFLMIIKALASLSSSALSSDSVGSIIRVSGMGKLTVGLWKEKSYNLFEISPAFIPNFLNGLISIINSCPQYPFLL